MSVKYTYAGTAKLTGGDLSQIQSIAVIKAAVRVASVPISTSSFNVSYTYSPTTQTITANSNGALTLDSVAVLQGDRVLIKDELSAQTNNGVYVVTQPGDASHPFILTRASDFNRTSNIPEGCLVPVVYGTVNATSLWCLSTSNPGGNTPYVLDSSPAIFSAMTESSGAHLNNATITNSTLSNCTIVTSSLLNCFVSLNYIQYASTDSGKTIDVSKCLIVFDLDDLTVGAPDPHATFTLPANPTQAGQLLVLLNATTQFIYPITINTTTFRDAQNNIRSSISLAPGQSLTITGINSSWYGVYSGYT